MTGRKKLLIGVGIVLVVGVFVVLALRRGRTGGVEVRAEAVQRRDLVAAVTASGRIRPHRSVDIQADVSGRIVELRVDEGDLVEKDDTLLILDRTAYEAAVQRARAQLSSASASAAQAKANLDQARRSRGRTEQLKKQNPDLISDEQLESAETNFKVQSALYEAAQFQVEQSRASLREALDRLAKTVITAPMAGRVTRLNVDEGETAIVGTMNNPGTVLLTIGDLSEMEAVLEVDETDVPEIELGDSVSVNIDAYPDQSFVGRVTEIANSSIQGAAISLSTSPTSDQSVDFEVIVRLADPPPSLRPDLSATADIVTAIRDSVLSIPIIALTMRAPDSLQQAPRERVGQTIPLGSASDSAKKDVEGVFVVQDAVAKFRPVKVGIAGRDYFEVLDGLQEGDTIVAGSYQAIRQLHDGAHLKVQKTRPAGRASIALESGSSGTGGDDVAEAATPTTDSSMAAPQTSTDSNDSAAADTLSASSAVEGALPYSVLLVSFSSLDDALARQRKWSRPDLPVYVAPTPIRGRVFYRVFAGTTGGRPAAEALMKRLASEGLKADVRDWDVRPARYAFRLGTFEDAGAARSRVEELGSQGVPAYMVRAAGGAGSSYYVYAGGYESVDDAQPMRDLLARAGLEAELVERTGIRP